MADPVEPTPSPPVRVSRELPDTSPRCPGGAWFDRVTVELPADPPTLGRWDLARQLADGLVRGETTLVFPPGAVVTYSVEPPVAASLASVIHPAPIPDPTTVCVTVFTVDGGTLVVERMPVADADALVEAFRGPTTLTNQVLTVTLDDCAVTHLARRQITRIDLDFDAPATDD